MAKPVKKRSRVGKVLFVLWCAMAVCFWISFFWLIFQEKTYEFLQPRESIAEIRIGSCTDATYLYMHSDEEWLPLVVSGYRVHTELAPERFDAFLKDFHRLECRQWVNDPNPSIQGETVQILYSDGSMEWICAHGTFSWDSQTGTAKMTWYHFDKDAFPELLRSYGY